MTDPEPVRSQENSRTSGIDAENGSAPRRDAGEVSGTAAVPAATRAGTAATDPRRNNDSVHPTADSTPSRDIESPAADPADRDPNTSPAPPQPHSSPLTGADPSARRAVAATGAARHPEPEGAGADSPRPDTASHGAAGGAAVTRTPAAAEIRRADTGPTAGDGVTGSDSDTASRGVAGDAAEPRGRAADGRPGQPNSAGTDVGTERARGTVSPEPDGGNGGASGPNGPASFTHGRDPRRWSKVSLVFAGSVVLLVLLAMYSAAVGQVPTSPMEVVGSVLHRIGLDWGPLPGHPAGEVTLWEVRFPRVVLAVLVGAALATAGALLQGVFANPLAEPGVIGVSAGAAVGAGVVIVVGGAFAAAWSVAGGAFVAGLGTTLLVYLLSRSGGRTETVTLVLTGVAVNAFAGGLMAFLLFTASPAARDQIVFWQLGSLNGATWQSVAVVAPLTAFGVAAAVVLAPRLDLLALGESAARHLGVDVERLRRNVIVIVAILATAGVAFTGIILFVGLIVPHLVRMLVGPAHRVLIPLSALVGAIVLLAADVGARTLVANADLPLGMLTSLIGGPFFFWLLRRTRARSGGWA